jgi:DNA recombination-dependent growth factor C
MYTHSHTLDHKGQVFHPRVRAHNACLSVPTSPQIGEAKRKFEEALPGIVSTRLAEARVEAIER